MNFYSARLRTSPVVLLPTVRTFLSDVLLPTVRTFLSDILLPTARTFLSGIHFHFSDF
jgi:hypothetical protein